MSTAFKPLLSRLADGHALDPDQARAFLAACLKGEPTPAQVAAALTALRMRGETVEEISAFAEAMREAATTLDHPYDVHERDLLGRAGEAIAAVHAPAAPALEQAATSQLGHGRGQEAVRQHLRLGDLATLHRHRVPARDLEQRPDGVVGASRDAEHQRMRRRDEVMRTPYYLQYLLK